MVLTDPRTQRVGHVECRCLFAERNGAIGIFVAHLDAREVPERERSLLDSDAGLGQHAFDLLARLLDFI
jgi:hypothetical protein